jgi:hypothetical protein
MLILVSQVAGQKLNEYDIHLNNFTALLETASRSSQKVFVDDFTGLL